MVEKSRVKKSDRRRMSCFSSVELLLLVTVEVHNKK
jgi:hypothetical protein